MTIPTDIANRLINRSVHCSNGCIITTWKKTQRGGHTLVKIQGKQKLAHRLAWQEFRGIIPTGLQVNHLCNNSKCINVEHLYLGTQKENIRDSINAGTFPWTNLKSTTI